MLTTGAAHDTLAAPQLQLEQVAGGATRLPWPSKRLEASASHAAAAAVPTYSATGPIQPEGAAAAHEPPFPHDTTTSAAAESPASASLVTSVVASPGLESLPVPPSLPPSPRPPV
jgi:hypothetical protein